MARYDRIDSHLEPHDRLYAAILRQAMLDAKSGEAPHAAQARQFLSSLGVPLDQRGRVDSDRADWKPSDLLAGWQ